VTVTSTLTSRRGRRLRQPSPILEGRREKRNSSPKSSDLRRSLTVVLMPTSRGAAEKYLKTTTYQLESGWKHHGPAGFVLKRKRSDSKGRASMTSSKKPRTSGPRHGGYGGGLVYIESLWGGISIKAIKDQIVPHPNSVTGTPGRPQA
jgi:hypothetical protein